MPLLHDIAFLEQGSKLGRRVVQQGGDFLKSGFFAIGEDAVAESQSDDKIHENAQIYPFSGIFFGGADKSDAGGNLIIRRKAGIEGIDAELGVFAVTGKAPYIFGNDAVSARSVHVDVASHIASQLKNSQKIEFFLFRGAGNIFSAKDPLRVGNHEPKDVLHRQGNNQKNNKLQHDNRY